MVYRENGKKKLYKSQAVAVIPKATNKNKKIITKKHTTNKGFYMIFVIL